MMCLFLTHWRGIFQKASEEGNGNCWYKLSGPPMGGADNIAETDFLREVQRGRNDSLRRRRC